MRLRNKILSVILAITVITSVLPVSLVVNAGSGDGGSGSVDTGGTLNNWSITTNEHDVIVIRASCITDDVTIDNMASINYRYGNGGNNGVNINMTNYPLYMLTGRGKSHNEGYTTDIDSIKEKMKSEYNEWSSYNKYKCTLEYINGGEDVSTIASTVKADSGETPYLEDIVGKAYNNSNLSNDDLKALWYFYTRIATGVNKDTVHGSYGSHLGSTLHRTLLEGVASNSNNAALFQRGYVVALAVAYGFSSVAVKNIINSGYSSGSQTYWQNGFKSLVIDKAVVVNNSFMNSSSNRFGIKSNYAKDDVIITVHAFTDLCRRFDDRVSNSINPFREFPIVGNEYGTVAMCNNGGGKPISMWWSIFRGMVGDIAPAYSFTKDGKTSGADILDSNGNKVFTGWGYYEIATNVNLESYSPYNTRQEQIATEVTYNAYLSTDGKVSDERDSFSNNGRVMTDTVYLSKPFDIKKVIQEAPGEKNIVDAYKYMLTTVDKDIYLSTPAEGTKYSLARLSYQITNANGTYSIDSNNEYLSGTRKVFNSGSTEVTDGKISTLGSDINTARNSSDMKIFIRTCEQLEDHSVQSGFWGDSSNPGGYYYVYNNYNDTTPIQYKGKSVTTNISGDFIKDKRYESYNKSHSYSDHTENSNNYFYIKFSDGQKWPAIYINGSWYICKLTYVNNILVQYRADYIANMTDTDNYNKLYKDVEMPEYLLAQNANTNDFTKKDIYTMIDNYATNIWGTLAYRSYSYATNTIRSKSYNNNVDTDGNESLDAFRYNYFLRDSKATVFGGNGTGTDDNNSGWTKEEYQLSNTISAISGNVRKLGYIYELKKTAAIMSSRTGTFINLDLRNNVYRFYNMIGVKYNDGDVNANIRATVVSPLSVQEDGSYLPSCNTGYTTNGNRSSSIKELPADSLVPGRSSEYIKYASESTIKAKDQISGVNIRDGVYYIGFSSPENNVYLKDKDEDKIKDEKALERNWSRISGYNEVFFAKLLINYTKYIYSLRGNMASDYTPYVANWVGTSLIGGMTSNSVGKTLPTKVENGVTKTILEISKKDGFVRFGQSIMSVQNANGSYSNQPYWVETASTKAYNQNVGVPMSISKVYTDSSINRTILSTSDVAPKKSLLSGPFTQSSVDVPINYIVKSHNTLDIGKKVKTQTYSKGSNTVSLSWQHGTDGASSTGGTFITIYPEVRMWAENDKTSKPSDETTYTSVTTVGAKPRYIPAMTYTTAKFNDLKADVSVIGTAVAYDTRAKKLAQTLGTADTQVLYSGTAINGTASVNAGGSVKTYVFDFRDNGVLNGQNIKRAWGNADYNATVIASNAMQRVLNNFEVSQSSSLVIYNGKDSADGYKEIDIGSSIESGALTAGTASIDPIIYNIYLVGGVVSKVVVQTRTGYTICTYEKIKNGVVAEKFTWGSDTKGATLSAVEAESLSNSEKEVVKEFISADVGVIKARVDLLLDNMKVSEIATNVFEHGTGVGLPNGLINSNGEKFTSGAYAGKYCSYNEDCSVLQIRSYTAPIVAATSKATFAEQIPINVGPQTPADKNKYFSNGYKGFVNTEAKIKVKNTITGVFNAGDTLTYAVSKHKKSGSTAEVVVNNYSTAKVCIPDFIIGDVPISEALNG